MQPRVRPELADDIRRYAPQRAARFNRFIADFIARKTERPERDQRRSRAVRKRRSRLKQSAKMKDGSIQIGLGNGDSIKELNA